MKVEVIDDEKTKEELDYFKSDCILYGGHYTIDDASKLQYCCAKLIVILMI